MNSEININLDTPDNHGYFIVTCFGLSGSHWLSHALHRHSDITCVHSEEHILPDESLASNERLLETVYERFQARIKREEILLDQFFENVRTLGDTKVLGGVHTHRVYDIAALENKQKATKKFVLVNMVRHPVSFVNSGVGHIKDVSCNDIYVYRELLTGIVNRGEFFWRIVKDHNLDILSKEFVSFAGACIWLTGLGRDIKTGPNLPYIQMEQMTSNRDFFKKVVQQLVQDKVDITEEYLDSVFDIGAVNKHRHGKRLEPHERYAKWEPWQKEIFNAFVINSNIISKYQSIGYDFSFLDTSVNNATAA